MCVNWHNPYENIGAVWVKGNVHAHFSPRSRCAIIGAHELTQAYSQKGYNFLGITNHLHLPDAEPGCDTAGLVLLPGTEWNSRTPYMEDDAVTYQDHYGLYSEETELIANCLAAKTPGAMLELCRNKAVFSVLHHPNWLFPAHTSPESLLLYAPQVQALEIYNAGIARDPGNACATHNWDILLGSGVRILGVAGDDAHRVEDIGKAWIMVGVTPVPADPAGKIDARTILQSLMAGRFYASTGLSFESIRREEDRITATTREECRLRIVTDFGAIAHEVKGRGISWAFSGGCTYARISADGAYGAQAWTQPFFYDGH